MRRLFPSMLAACVFTVSQAQAGAWTQKAGEGQLIVSGVYYSADQLYNNQGDKRSQPTYSKYELNPYAEYGLCDIVTVGANLSFLRAHQDGAGGAPGQTNWGVGDSEWFARIRLMQSGGCVVSAEPMVKLPSPESGRDLPRLGGSHPDAGLGLAAGYGFSAFGQNHFAELATQYRHRLGDPKDQLKIAATVGIHATQEWMILPQVFITQRTSDPAAVTFTQSAADDYNAVKLQLSAVYEYSDDVSFQFGGFADVDGKNAGKGHGALVSVWKKF